MGRSLLRRGLCLWLSLWTVAAIGGCAAEGTFEIAFEWQITPPDASTALEVVAEVRSPSGQVTPAGPIAYSPSARLRFREVPNGRDLVVEVRIYTDGDLVNGRPPKFFGRSAPFDLLAGQSLRVPVAIRLTDAPQINDVVVAGTDGRNAVRQPQIRLRLHAIGAETFEVAQNALFTFAQRSFSASDNRLGQDAAGEIFLLDYNLDDELDCQPNCGDGLRSLFVRSRRDGFVSEVATVAVDLDRRSPALANVQVVYLPGPDSPLADPAEARVGTEVIVRVVADERLASGRLMATNGTSEIAFASMPSAETGLTFSAVVTSTHSDGTYVPTLQLNDRALNSSGTLTLSTPQIKVRTSVPALAIEQTAISYLRAPSGTLNETSPIFALTSSDGAPDASLAQDVFRFSDRPLVRIRVWADAAATVLLGATSLGGDGRWEPLRLNGVDVPIVFVSGIDPAGNESSTTPVERIWYTVRSDPAAHASIQTFETTSHVVDAVVQPLTTPIGDRNAVTLRDGIGAVTRSTGRWRLRGPGAYPQRGRSLYGAAYDSRRGRGVVFGGVQDGQTLGDVREWNGRQLSNATPASDGPGARRGAAVAYDQRRGRTVVYGGLDDALQLRADTWEWDGVRWVEVTPDTPSPAPRTGASMAFDGATGRLLLFGGDGGLQNGAPRIFDDSWVWDGDVWTELAPPGPRPAPRRSASLAYDPDRRRTVLFGGDDGNFGELNDLWEWDGVRWFARPQLSVWPSPRADAGAAFDPLTRRILVVNGRNFNPPAPSTTFRQTWAWDGTAWEEVASDPQPPGTLPMFMDTTEGVATGIDAFGGGWAWLGDRWSPYGGAIQTVPRRLVSMVYDEARGRMTMFGGLAFDGTYDGGTVEWNRTEWLRVDVPSPTPEARARSTFVYDSARQLAVLFGGTDGSQVFGDLWTYNGAWFRSRQSQLAPVPRGSAEMVFDRARAQSVLFGGVNGNQLVLGDTWILQGTAWSRRIPANSPSPREAHAMAYDERRSRVVLFGGVSAAGSALGDIWEWDGSNWTEVTPSSGASPRPRFGARMAYDPIRQAVLLFGGGDVETLSRFNDLWRWDGLTWVDVTPTDSPPARDGHGFAWDPVAGHMIASIGSSAADFLIDTWELSAPGAPAFQLTVRLPDDIDFESISTLDVRAACWGSRTSQVVATGSGLWLYTPGTSTDPYGGWRPRAVHGLGAPSPVDPNAVDLATRVLGPQEVGAWILRRDRTIAAQCRPPTSAEAIRQAEVAADAMQISVEYTARPDP